MAANKSSNVTPIGLLKPRSVCAVRQVRNALFLAHSTSSKCADAAIFCNTDLFDSPELGGGRWIYSLSCNRWSIDSTIWINILDRFDQRRHYRYSGKHESKNKIGKILHIFAVFAGQ